METIDQFPTQTQEETNSCKRKFLAMEIDIDSEEEDEYSIHPHSAKGWVEKRGQISTEKYAVRPAGYSWDEYRKTHGQGTVGGGVSDELKATSRTLEDIKVFVVSII